MGYSANPNGSDLIKVTVILQYGVFATLLFVLHHRGTEYDAGIKKGRLLWTLNKYDMIMDSCKHIFESLNGII